MRTALLALMALVISLPVTTVAQQQAKCPAEAATARRIADRVASSSGYASFRTKYNLPELTSADVRLLGRNGDNGVCGRIVRLLEEEAPALLEVDPATGEPSWQLTFYEAGEHYYAVAVRTPRKQAPVAPGHVRVSTGWSPLFVIDGKGRMRVIAKVAV